MNTSRFTFCKSERLKGKIRIDTLYKEGKSFVAFPFFVKYTTSEETTSNQILISVSKRRFKNASDRNLIRRRIREAYRLNKNTLSISSKQISINFIGKTPLDYTLIEKKMILLLKRLNKLNTNE